MSYIHGWGKDPAQIRTRVARFARECGITPETEAELLARQLAFHYEAREAYLATLPEISRMGRLIWIHARRNEVRT